MIALDNELESLPSLDDIKIISKLPTLRRLKIPEPSPANTKGWTNLSTTLERSISLRRMTAAIPSSMMQTIEQQASTIAGGVSSGQMNMADVDLSKIGDEVMSNCSQHDMAQLAGNLDTLMPSLQSLTRSIGQDGGEMPQQMQEMMSKVTKATSAP